MREFWTLFKYEFKMHTPFIRRGDKKDWLGLILGILAMGFVAAVCVIFLKKILGNYCLVEYNFTQEPLDRAIEKHWPRKCCLFLREIMLAPPVTPGHCSVLTRRG